MTPPPRPADELVKRLRYQARETAYRTSQSTAPDDTLEWQAADTIERLQSELRTSRRLEEAACKRLAEYSADLAAAADQARVARAVAIEECARKVERSAGRDPDDVAAELRALPAEIDTDAMVERVAQKLARSSIGLSIRAAEAIAYITINMIFPKGN